LRLRTGLIVLGIIVIVFLGSISEVAWIASSNQSIAPGSLTPWISTTSLPNQEESSCVGYGGFAYCVGDTSGSAYFATLNSSGIGKWSRTTTYPAPNFSYAPDCVADLNYIYCEKGAANDSLVYYASINSSGIGTWIQTQSYPSYINGENCVTYSGFIYCLGSEKANNPVNASALDYVYYAKIGTNGLSSWNETTSYPVAALWPSCVAISEYIYCSGGQNVAIAGPCSGANCGLTSVFYARLSSSGVSHWIATTGYPFPVSAESCAAYSTSIYCVGGLQYSLVSSAKSTITRTSSAYYATANSSGVFSWTKASVYPISTEDSQCLSFSNNVYCIGGYNGRGLSLNASYYSEVITAPALAALTEQRSTTYSVVSVFALVTIVLASVVAVLVGRRIIGNPRLDSKQETEQK
jgi:hypothetical protein